MIFFVSKILGKNIQNIDLEIDIDDLTVEVIEDITKLNQISGTGFKAINVLVRGLPIIKVEHFLNKHLKIHSKGIELIQWNTNPNYQELRSDDESIIKTIDVVGIPGIGSWMGRTTRQIIIDSYIINETFSWLL